MLVCDNSKIEFLPRVLSKLVLLRTNLFRVKNLLLKFKILEDLKYWYAIKSKTEFFFFLVIHNPYKSFIINVFQIKN